MEASDPVMWEGIGFFIGEKIFHLRAIVERPEMRLTETHEMKK